MLTQDEIKQRIAAIDEKLASGVRSVTVDGTSTTIDLAELRKERSDLEQQLPATKLRRPQSARIYLGGF